METKNKKELTLTRVFNAPIKRVWNALTTPGQFVKWYGLSNSTMSDMKMDVRVGGGWSGVMHIPGYPDISWRAEYIEVNPPEKLVFKLKNPDDHNDPNTETVTIILRDLDSNIIRGLDSKTEMFFNQSGNLPDDEYQKALRDGWTSFFNRLDEVLDYDEFLPKNKTQE
ncbi:MAG TPA: SRPBCC domain-containing protein [Candidatus Limnocylindrales bacterium]|nr:SRPBCC domain-containing protein [Candidatus Limnocylindrales bacterium]